tara:strand:+ start:995 stop:1459 length:465 start_codon:yes stop_codon:yes gene_type:complete
MGTVVELNLFRTEFKTPNGISIIVPNGSVWGASVTNYSCNPTRRINIVVGISQNDNIDKERYVLLSLMTANDRLLKNHVPETMVVTLCDSSVNINMRGLANSGDYWGTLFDLNQSAKVQIKAAGCSIPYPQQDVHMIAQGDGLDTNHKRIWTAA